MPPLPNDLLTDKALHALIEYTRLHQHGTVTDREKPMLRFLLAYLYRGGDRSAYDDYWREACREKGAVEAHEFGRFQSMRGALAQILRAHGREYW